MDSKSKILTSYLDKSDWRVKENSTVDFSTGGLTLHNSGAIVADYWLKEVYPEEIADAHRNADFHIHDLSFLSAYCAGWSLKDLLIKGLGGLTGKITSAPPKHLTTAVLQMVNFLGIMQNEWAGAQAFSSFDTLLAPFVKIEDLPYEQVKQAIQMFVFGANVPSRWGCVDEDTEILTPDGFKHYNELNVGDEVYTWKNNTLNCQTVNQMNIYDFDGILHFYYSTASKGSAPMRQLVTPNHRVLFSAPGIDQQISMSINIFDKIQNMAIPCMIVGNNIGGVDVSNEDIETAATIDFSTEEYEWLIHMDRQQALLFIDSLPVPLFELAYSTKEYVDRLQHIFFIAGESSWIEQKSDLTYFLCQGETSDVIVQKMDIVNYKGKVWCPTTDDGIVVFRKDGVIFISGNSQSPFTNITLDWTVPKDLAAQQAIVGGKPQEFTYSECQPEMDLVNKALLDVFLGGDANGRGFQYPIITYNLTKDFEWEHPNTELLFKITAKYGTPYFQNFINSDLEPESVRAMCCRLQLDKRELLMRGGGLFGSAELTGSIGVVTLNMPRLGYISADINEFYSRLGHLMDLAAESLHLKREKVKALYNQGLYPYTKHYLPNFNNHFSTIGLVGMNECVLNAKWLGQPLHDPASYAFTKEVLNFMRNRLQDYQEKYGDLYNLEATPAESTSYRLALHDKRKFKDIKSVGNTTAYYTNSTNFDVSFNSNLFEVLDMQEELQQKYTGGTVVHVYLGESINEWQSARNIVKKIAENYKIPYFTISPTYSICSDHGYIAGKTEVCPYCNKETEIYSRITGYYRPVSNWNDGKQEEFKQRVTYHVPTS